MENISIKVFPANGGDSILIIINELKYNILVDTGYGSTFSKYIKPTISKLDRANILDQLIITHIDNDHILGGIKLLKDNERILEDKANEQVVDVRNVLYNGYMELTGCKKLECKHDEKREKIIKELDLELCGENEDFIEEDIGNVGYKEGDSFSSLLKKGKALKYIHNHVGIIKQQEVYNNILDIAENVKIIVLTPGQNQVNELLVKWRKYLEDKGIKEELSEEDEILFEKYNSIKKEFKEKLENVGNKGFNLEELSEVELKQEREEKNASSISFLLIVNQEKYLFAGDAYPADILESLEELLNGRIINDMNFEVFKVPHHGSKNNISDSLLSTIHCKRYIISTNGAHNHPDNETVAKIIHYDPKCTLYFNYKLGIVKTLNDIKSENKYEYNVVAVDGEKGEILEI